MAREQYEDQSVTGQLAALDTEQKSLAKRIDELAGDMQRGFASIYVRLDAISERSISKAATNWGTLASWAAVVLTMGGIIGALAINPIITHVDKLDATLQREMRLLDDGMRNEMNEKIAASARERILLLASNEQRIKAVEDRAQRIDDAIGREPIVDMIQRLMREKKP